METPNGEIAVHLRALHGFPDDAGHAAAYFDASFVVLELVVRLIPRNDDASGARFRCLRRPLTDFVHLEQQLASVDSANTSIQPTSVLILIKRYEDALSQQRFAAVASLEERFLGQLEGFLASVLSSFPVCSSSAVKRFFGLEAASCPAELVDRGLMEASGEHATLLGGGSFRHEVPVVADSYDESLVIVWQFAFDGDAVDLSVTYTPATSVEGASLVAVEPVDPYSEAALAWTDDPKHGDADSEAKRQLVLQYSTRYERQRGDTKWAYGISRVPSIVGSEVGGVVTFDWCDASETSIFSKTLQFQTSIVRGGTSDAADALIRFVDSEEQDDEDASLLWLEKWVACSSLTAWPSESREEEEDSCDDTIHVDGYDDGSATDEASRVKDVHLRELEGKMFKLEEELQAARQELKQTKSELEISSEIYKASLETIAHLETTPSRFRPPNDPSADHAHDDDNDSYGGSEGVFESDGEGEDHEPVDGETSRLRDLVATFQEQCLWRSIETSESEKRNLVLQAQLHRTDEELQTLTQILAAKDQQLDAIQAENSKLKAQKSVLVKEVKRLQPYTQVNLLELIREAEEARMMQRSLQLQLQALQAASSPETDHPRQQLLDA